MAAAKMCLRKNKEETAEWTGLFLSDLRTKHESLVFVKRMIAVAVSSITYLRGIFPEDAYRSRYLEDLCVKVLHEDCNSPGASKVVKWMMGCFDALEKQYLQIVFIGVYTNPDEPNCIIESYQFKFKYTGKGPQMDILRNDDVEMQVTLEDTKRASVLLIRKLFLLMQNLDALPKNVYLTMKLYYYDDMKNNCPAPLSKSLLLTTNHQASRRVSVTVCGLKAWPCTSSWARCRRRSTASESMCRPNKVDWRSFRKGTN
ncbi:putative HORMA domain-containing protein 1-like isoform 4 [Scophthalmus maximus]|uniref:Putative HORMA domain-containing protein 1-like isoform 4 n=1 Tax=Scophthalmus maximus TaxID=52904 RepID=A0A2U9BL04_SCOMX|nr:putative HORMA domain-containing protein 1-like isoform 4 [Scophthalmus maximus]